MFKRAILALTFAVAFALPAQAQNTTCSNRPNGDNSNACANTRFVQTNVPLIGIVVGTTPVLSGTDKGILYNNAAILGNTNSANKGLLVTSATGAPSITSTIWPITVTATGLTYNGFGAINVVDDAAGAGTAAITGITYGGAGAANTGAVFHGVCANGSAASPTVCGPDKLITGVGGIVYDGTAIAPFNGFSSSSPASMHLLTAETQGNGTNGAYFNFYTTTIGTAYGARKQWLTFTQDQTLWAKDTTLTFNNLSTTQTKPIGNIFIMASGASPTMATVAYGSGTVTGYRVLTAGGTPATPAGTPAGAQLGFLGGYGYADNTAAWVSAAAALIQMRSAEAGVYSSTANGSYIALETTTIGAAASTRTERMRIQDDGSVGIGTSTKTGNGTLNVSSTVFTPIVAGGTGASSTLTLESTSGTGTGDSVVVKTGSQSTRATVNTSGTWNFGAAAPSTTGTNIPIVSVNTSATTIPNPGTAATGTQLMLANSGGTTSQAFVNYGGQSIVQGFVAGGTVASPTATATTTSLFNFQGVSWDGTEWGNGGVQTPNVSFRMQTAQAQSAGNHGTQIILATTPNGSTTLATAITVQNSGGVSIGTSTDPGIGALLTNTFMQATTYVQVGTKIRAVGTAPALTSCGGGSPAIVGSDLAGEVTMGTTATGCVITFNVAYASAPYCTVTWQATPLASQSYTVSTTAITLTQTSTSGNKVNYYCAARSGG